MKIDEQEAQWVMNRLANGKISKVLKMKGDVLFALWFWCMTGKVNPPGATVSVMPRPGRPTEPSP